MAILVTGGAGYIGSVTVEYLLSCGEKVVVLDNLSRGHREAVDSHVPFYAADVGDRALLTRIALEEKIDSCIHFAASAFVSESVQNPRMYFENNVEQGIALLGALLQGEVRRIVFFSSCVSYGEPEKLPVKEDDSCLSERWLHMIRPTDEICRAAVLQRRRRHRKTWRAPQP